MISLQALGALVVAGSASLKSVHPSASTLESTAQIGATLLVAYAVEASWLMTASRSEGRPDREFRLGVVTATGASAGIAILLSLVLADRLQAHHWAWPDYLGLGWIAVSLVSLGGIVVMQPWLTHEWSGGSRVE